MADDDLKILRPNVSGQVIIPRHVLQERVDQLRREEWEDPDRFAKKKLAALRYIPVRAKDLPDELRLLSEVKRVFHDDLAQDADIKEAIQRAVHKVHVDAALAEEPVVVPPSRANKQNRNTPRGMADLDEEDIRDLEWQLKVEREEP